MDLVLHSLSLARRFEGLPCALQSACRRPERRFSIHNGRQGLLHRYPCGRIFNGHRNIGTCRCSHLSTYMIRIHNVCLCFLLDVVACCIVFFSFFFSIFIRSKSAFSFPTFEKQESATTLKYLNWPDIPTISGLYPSHDIGKVWVYY